LLPDDIASAAAVISSPKQAEFTFKWAGDGQSVALLRNGDGLAFVTITERLGFSKAVIKATPLANPWDEKLYSSVFGQ